MEEQSISFQLVLRQGHQEKVAATSADQGRDESQAERLLSVFHKLLNSRQHFKLFLNPTAPEP